MKTKEEIAAKYAEDHSINGYKVKGNRMIYYVNSNGLTTKVIVRLNTLTREEQVLTYWNPKGDFNANEKERKDGEKERTLQNQRRNAG